MNSQDAQKPMNWESSSSNSDENEDDGDDFEEDAQTSSEGEEEEFSPPSSMPSTSEEEQEDEDQVGFIRIDNEWNDRLSSRQAKRFFRQDSKQTPAAAISTATTAEKEPLMTLSSQVHQSESDRVYLSCVKPLEITVDENRL